MDRNEDWLRGEIAARLLEEHDMTNVLVQERTGEITGPSVLLVHKAEYCQGREFGCVIHGASKHHMREWPLVWNQDGHFMSRLCEHNELHVDPDDAAFRESIWQGRFMGGHTVSAPVFGNAINLRVAMMAHECICKCCEKEAVA